MRIILLLFLLGTPAAAQAPLSGEAFDRLTRGKTFYFTQDGLSYGAEQYRGDRRVIWTFLDGECLSGRWYEAGDAICFVYEDLAGPQCWLFYDQGGLRGTYLGGDLVLDELQRTPEPLNCPGPDLGV